MLNDEYGRSSQKEKGRTRTRSAHSAFSIQPCSCGFLVRLPCQLCNLEIADETDRVEDLQRNPADVELVPGEAVPGGDRMGVMVVVPPLAKREQCDPPAVARVVA